MGRPDSEHRPDASGGEPRSVQVLVLADERHERESLCRGLRLQGLEAFPAAGLADALARLSGPAGDAVDLLLAVPTAGGASASRMVERAREARPSLPVLVIVGLAWTADRRELRRRGVPVLQRPFDPARLAGAIRDEIRDESRDERNQAGDQVGAPGGTHDEPRAGTARPSGEGETDVD